MRFHFLSVRQSVQADLWNIPDGKLPDLSETFTDGTTLPLSWNGWTNHDFLDAAKTRVDLWVTGFDYNVNPFSQLLIGMDSCTNSRTAFFYPFKHST
jgi:hypothetical protein